MMMNTIIMYLHLYIYSSLHQINDSSFLKVLQIFITTTVSTHNLAETTDTRVPKDHTYKRKHGSSAVSIVEVIVKAETDPIDSLVVLSISQH